MFKKILFLMAFAVLASCGSSKKTASSKKRTVSKTRTETVRKPIATTKKAATRTNDSETLESTSRTTVYADVVRKYISDFSPIAKSNMIAHGIPASITLAQGILESGAGAGTLSKTANNHFGIKCHTGWTGESVRHDDDSDQECFRKYSDPAESYRDHSLFLTTRSRYSELFKLKKDDYTGWAKGLKAAGYATDPKYPDKLIGLIERYDLAKYDAEVLRKDYVPAINNEPLVSLDSNVYKVSQGDTLYSISKRFNTTVDDLKRLNNLSDNAISIGQSIKVK